MWPSTGNVDPVIDQMICLLQYHWGDDPDHAIALSDLDAIADGSRVDDDLSWHRAMLVVDRAIRRDLPRLLRSVTQRDHTAIAAAEKLEQLAPLTDASAVGNAMSLTFHLDHIPRGARPADHHPLSLRDRRMVGAAWYAARHAEQAISTGRIYQLGSAAVGACDMFILRSRDLADLADLGGEWAAARELAHHLAFELIREATSRTAVAPIT